MRVEDFRKIGVCTAGGSYDVWVGEGILGELGQRMCAIRRPSGVVVVTDSKVGPLYAEGVIASLRAVGFDNPVCLTVEAGERSKSMAQVEEICDAMVQSGLDRGGLLVALGGGVVGDLAGFAAAVFQRGIPFVQVPTTIVAQVDSSVGGKTGVNLPSGKNLAGAFHQPILVLADPLVLKSLPEREFCEGMAEAIKHGVIRDTGLLDRLDPSQRTGLTDLIARNVEIKAAVVQADERETSGERALLNFGHTVGHAIEQVAGYGRYLHGEAISIGMHVALRLSVSKAGLSEQDCAKVLGLLSGFHLPIAMPPELSTDALISALRRDKKFVAGQIRFVLTRALGSAFVSSDVGEQDIADAIDAIRAPGETRAT